MTDVDAQRLYATTDASVWAEEFAKVQPDVDKGLMIGWFANAIETARQVPTLDPPPVHVALANVARRVTAVSKRGVADQRMGGYSFRKYDDIVDAIHEWMAEEGVIPLWKHLSEPRHEPWSDKMHRYVAHVEFRFIGPAGDEIVTEAWCEALDNGDKGLGKAISYGLKDLLSRMLTLPFNDPTIDNEQQVTPERSQYEEGYERTYDANTVDTAVEEGISDEERAEIRKQIEALSDDQRAALSERWKKLTEAKALRPLDRFKPTDVPVFNDLLKNIKTQVPPCDDDSPAEGAVDSGGTAAAGETEGEAPAAAPLQCVHETCRDPKLCAEQGMCTEAPI